MTILAAVAATAAVAGMAGTVMSYQGQQATAKAQARAQQDAWKKNQEAALASDRAEQKQLTLRTIQEQDQTSQQNRAGALLAARQVAATQTSAAESNVSGVSLDNLVADLYRQERNNETARLSSYDDTVSQIAAAREAGVIKTEGRIKNYNLSPVNSASVGGLVSGLASGLGGLANAGMSSGLFSGSSSSGGDNGAGVGSSRAGGYGAAKG